MNGPVLPRASLLGWWLGWLVGSGLALAGSGCGDADQSAEPVAILAAFPAELAAVLEHVAIDETRVVAGRAFRLGRIEKTPVVVTMTGIGRVNAREATRVLLESFEVAGVVVSGVAGSPLLVGDVTVAGSWAIDDGSRVATHEPWVELAAGLTAAGGISLERCAIVPDVVPIPGVAPGLEVCFPSERRVAVGGFGTTSDSFGDAAFPCMPDGNDVFGCDPGGPGGSGGLAPVSVGPETPADLVRLDAATQAAYDMETADIARAAAARGLPFIAFRASSDGGPDPLDLDGFVEFFAYYRLAAHNAAAAAAAFVAELR